MATRSSANVKTGNRASPPGRPKGEPRSARHPDQAVSLLVATRKGLWTLQSDSTRRSWKLAGPHFLGHIVHHAVRDPRASSCGA